MDISKYLTAIDIEAAKEKRLLNIQVHHGYRATLERYLKDSTVLDMKELMGILSLYSIEDLEPTLPVEFDELIITYVPHARVDLSNVEPGIHITFVPQPRVDLQLPLTLTHVPQPRIALSGIAAQITFVPQPRVQLIIPLVITHVPHPRVSLTGVMPSVVITHVPQPRIVFASLDEPVLTFVPQPRVVIIDSTMQSVFYGIVLGNESVRPSAAQVNFANLILETYSSIGSELALRFPTNTGGWMVFALPESVQLRQSWYQDVNNQGAIGGPASPVNMANFWPDPEIKEHNGVSYRLYISKMRSEASGDGLYLIRDYMIK